MKINSSLIAFSHLHLRTLKVHSSDLLLEILIAVLLLLIISILLQFSCVTLSVLWSTNNEVNTTLIQIKSRAYIIKNKSTEISVQALIFSHALRLKNPLIWISVSLKTQFHLLETVSVKLLQISLNWYFLCAQKLSLHKFYADNGKRHVEGITTIHKKTVWEMLFFHVSFYITTLSSVSLCVFIGKW